MQSENTPRTNAKSTFFPNTTKPPSHVLLPLSHFVHPFFSHLHLSPRPPLSVPPYNDPMTCRLHRDRNQLLTQIAIRPIRYRRQIRHADRELLPATITIAVGVQRHGGAAVDAHALGFIASVGHILPAQPDARAVAIVIRLCADAGNGGRGGRDDEDGKGHRVLQVIGEARGGGGLIGCVGFGSGEDGHDSPRVAVFVSQLHSRACGEGEGYRVVGLEAESTQMGGVGATRE